MPPRQVSAPLFATAWGAALVKPLNPRITGGLRQQRARIVKDQILTKARTTFVDPPREPQ